MRTKKNNLGFSLVELVIVIAIMAILIAVLAPMFLRYVERSRQSTDADAVGNMINALQAVSVDTTLSHTPSGTFTLIWHCGDGGGGVIEVQPQATHEAAVHAIVGDSYQAKSAAARTPGAHIEITVDIDNVSRIVIDNGSIPSGVGQNDNFIDIINRLERNT